jgi:hypothetical protein
MGAFSGETYKPETKRWEGSRPVRRSLLVRILFSEFWQRQILVPRPQDLSCTCYLDLKKFSGAVRWQLTELAKRLPSTDPIECCS